jgi:hypothetical protein
LSAIQQSSLFTGKFPICCLIWQKPEISNHVVANVSGEGLVSGFNLMDVLICAADLCDLCPCSMH